MTLNLPVHHGRTSALIHTFRHILIAHCNTRIVLTTHTRTHTCTMSRRTRRLLGRRRRFVIGTKVEGLVNTSIRGHRKSDPPPYPGSFASSFPHYHIRHSTNNTSSLPSIHHITLYSSPSIQTSNSSRRARTPDREPTSPEVEDKVGSGGGR